MDAAELHEWMAFDLVEPFGSNRDDDRARGIMAAVFMAAGEKNVNPANFLKTWEPEAPVAPGNAMAAALARLDAMAAQGEGGDNG